MSKHKNLNVETGKLKMRRQANELIWQKYLNPEILDLLDAYKRTGGDVQSMIHQMARFAVCTLKMTRAVEISGIRLINNPINPEVL